jgi:hypothetical protein
MTTKKWMVLGVIPSNPFSEVCMPDLSALLCRRGLAALVVLALTACHEAPRTNPFDPVLTPGVPRGSRWRWPSTRLRARRR